MKNNRKAAVHPKWKKVGRPSKYGAVMIQTPIGFSETQHLMLRGICEHEKSRTRMNPSLADVVRAAVDWYGAWYQSQHGVKLLPVAEGKEGNHE